LILTALSLIPDEPFTHMSASSWTDAVRLMPVVLTVSQVLVLGGQAVYPLCA